MAATRLSFFEGKTMITRLFEITAWSCALFIVIPITFICAFNVTQMTSVCAVICDKEGT
jgi:hypothetical protein